MNYYYQTKTNVNYNNNSTTASDYVTGNGIDEYYPTKSYTTGNDYVPEPIEIKPKKVKYSMDKKIGNRSSMKTNKKQFTRMAVRRG